MYLSWVGQVSAGDALLDTDLRDTEIVTLGGNSYLFASTGANGGLTSYRIDANGGLAVCVDTAYFAGTSAIGGMAEYVEIGGALHMIIGGGAAAPFLGYTLDGNGGIGALSDPANSLLSMNNALAQSSGGNAIYIVSDEDGGLTSYMGSSFGRLLNTDQEQSNQSQESPIFAIDGGALLEMAQVGNARFLIATEPDTNSIVSYSVDSGTGNLSERGSIGASDGLGVQVPTALEVVQAFGSTFLVVAAAESNSISVLQIDATGNLSAVDHVIDTSNTRFGNVQSLSLVETDNRVFIVAGGGDDGLSLFTMLPDGRLIHLQSLAHQIGLGLMDISQIDSTISGQTMQIFVSSHDAAGLAQFNVDLGNIGEIVQDWEIGGQVRSGTAGDDILIAGLGGYDTLEGGAGNDILVAAESQVFMRGGAGADRFVMAETHLQQRILDFEAGVDRLDLSSFDFLRGTYQLEFNSNPGGARIFFRDSFIDIRSASGGPLTIDDVFPGGFDHPDRVLVLGTPTGSVMSGSDENDMIVGTTGDDTIEGAGGADFLRGYGANDSIVAGWGHDTVYGDAGDDRIDAGYGDDNVFGGVGHDHLDAGSGNNVIYGANGQDTIMSGDGNDFVGSGADNDSVSSGGGHDTIWSNDGNDTVQSGWGHDSIGLGLGDDLLDSGDGNDTVWTSSGNDSVIAGFGNDLLGGYLGNDTLEGQGGNDTLWGAAGDDRLLGGDGDDHLGGGTGRDTIEGNAGDDSLWGGGENDRLNAGAGDDVLFGGNGNDQLRGEAGHDSLWSGDGNDQLWGGAGADSFFFSLDHGQDRIHDFEIGTDTILIYDSSGSFSSLSMWQQGDDVVVALGTGRIVLVDVTVASLGASDFEFL